MNDMALLIEPLIPALRRYARALTQDRSAADDLVQDSLERAISRWHQRRPDGDVRAWIFTILHNLAINRLRQTRRRGQHVPIEEADDTALSRPAVQEDALRRRDILKALAELSVEQRTVLLLVSVENLSYAQAASVLGIPVGTVMSRLSRGRESLRQAMAGEAVAFPSRGANLRRVK